MINVLCSAKQEQVSEKYRKLLRLVSELNGTDELKMEVHDLIMDLFRSSMSWIEIVDLVGNAKKAEH